MADFQGNQFVMENPGDSSHDNFPGQQIYVGEVHLYGGDDDDNVLLLDTDGQPYEPGSTNKNGIQLDPQVIASGTISASTYTRVPVNRRVRGLFLDDIPVGGKVEVYHGAY